MKEIDARGLSCPAPVLQTKAVVEQEKADAVRVVVDTAASQQNVKRFLESQGFETARKTGWRLCRRREVHRDAAKKKKPRSLSLRATSN